MVSCVHVRFLLVLFGVEPIRPMLFGRESACCVLNAFLEMDMKFW